MVGEHHQHTCACGNLRLAWLAAVWLSRRGLLVVWRLPQALPVGQRALPMRWQRGAACGVARLRPARFLCHNTPCARCLRTAHAPRSTSHMRFNIGRSATHADRRVSTCMHVLPRDITNGSSQPNHPGGPCYAYWAKHARRATAWVICPCVTVPTRSHIQTHVEFVT